MSGKPANIISDSARMPRGLPGRRCSRRKRPLSLVLVQQLRLQRRRASGRNPVRKATVLAQSPRILKLGDCRGNAADDRADLNTTSGSDPVFAALVGGAGRSAERPLPDGARAVADGERRDENSAALMDWMIGTAVAWLPIREKIQHCRAILSRPVASRELQPDHAHKKRGGIALAAPFLETRWSRAESAPMPNGRRSAGDPSEVTALGVRH